MAEPLTSLFPPNRSGRTFLIAVCVLGTIAAGQLLALSWHLIRHTPPSRAQKLSANAANPATASAAPSPASVAAIEPPKPIAPPDALSAPATAGAAPAASAETAASAPLPLMPADAAPVDAPPALARPTPAVGERSQFSPADLLEQAREARQRGDMRSALARLRDAQAVAPDSPMLIAETALTYEAMQLNDRAFEQWQRLYNMGESTGALYYMADGRLHSAPVTNAPPNTTPLANLALSKEYANTGRDHEGFQENAVLKVTNLSLQEMDDPDAEKKLSLKIAVKNKPGVIIDPNKVTIKAIFYDLIDGKDVVMTNAVTGYHWMTAPVNWTNDETEILETTYLRAKSAAEPSPSPTAAVEEPTPSETPAARPLPPPSRANRGRNGKAKPGAEAAPASAPTPAPTPAKPQVRTYLGYSVWLYYDRQLQDQQADPIRLLQQFPPPLTLSPEKEAALF